MTEQTACHNCGQALAGPFCAACGQKASPLDPSLRDVLHHVADELFSIDGRIFRSAQKLLLSPGFLTLEYFRGRRVRWVAPLRLYLMFSVIYFGLNAFAPATNTQLRFTGSEDETAAELRKLGFQNEQELEAAIARAEADWVPRVMFVLVPLFAGLVQVACRRTPHHYPQHLYFALNVHAAWFAAACVVAVVRLIFGADSVAAMTAGSLTLVYAVVYLVLAFRTVYGGPLRRAVLRAAAVGVVYVIAVGLSVIAVVVPIIYSRS